MAKEVIIKTRVAIMKYKILERLWLFVIDLANQIFNFFLIIVNEGDISPYKALQLVLILLLKCVNFLLNICSYIFIRPIIILNYYIKRKAINLLLKLNLESLSDI